ncbi:hypothetical protein O6P43_011003 [Quillaja saponaria]|uniref:Uncharacterized protein n=1 Tax=Quillaja saponaria TaxID=32244 RepID=A0AAD7Q264_QUISA|nr:hypothetical protein O6P43_011003 [Quillaja saponaria]
MSLNKSASVPSVQIGKEFRVLKSTRNSHAYCHINGAYSFKTVTFRVTVRASSFPSSQFWAQCIEQNRIGIKRRRCMCFQAWLVTLQKSEKSSFYNPFNKVIEDVVYSERKGNFCCFFRGGVFGAFEIANSEWNLVTDMEALENMDGKVGYIGGRAHLAMVEEESEECWRQAGIGLSKWVIQVYYF